MRNKCGQVNNKGHIMRFLYYCDTYFMNMPSKDCIKVLLQVSPADGEVKIKLLFQTILIHN